MKQENGYKKGFWTEEEDKILTGYVRKHGEGRWNRVTRMTGLRRCGKSCRLRWINYLCPSVNRDDFSEEEDDLIIRLHNLLGNSSTAKSCRLRWINYLCPSVNRNDFSEEEDDLIIRLHNLLGNRWSLIAGRLPGRTDNQVKNHWNTHLRKKLGIEKEENKVRASSRAIPITVRENFNNSLQTNLGALLPNGNQETTNQKPVLENDTTRFLDSPKMTMNDESSFRFPDDDLSLNNPNLEQLLDQNSQDLATNQKSVLENDYAFVSTTRFLDSLKMTMNDESSFWFPDDDLSLNNPNLEQLLDQNPLNFVWNGF